ncbi:L-threonine O-3-phosphate decarboxylase [Leptolyngbyaceae cyanobacterium JSC-12]|nr:L-threonine O-3-phosphate decarboxylase [Leptolyngbyaceae cyanobacterium JSC-12]
MNRPAHGGNLVWAAELADCSPDAILDFSASINPLGPPASAIAAIQHQLGNLVSYPDPSYSRLRWAISQFHHISPDWILPGNGAAELLTWSARDLAELDITYLFTPAFSDYTRALNAFDAIIQAVPLRLGHTPSELDGLPFLHPSGSTGLLLNTPHNPTGQLFSREFLLQCLPQCGLMVVDEAFMDFLPPDQQQSLIEWVEEYPNLVIVRSLTKFYSLPGLRLGYAIAHPDRLKRWQQWRDPWSVNSLAAAVGEVVLQDRAFQHQTWNWLATARSQLFAGLANLPGLYPFYSAANFLLVQSDYSVVDLQMKLLKTYKILIRDCLSFPELGDRYFRVAIRTQAENQRLLDGLEEILVSRNGG